MILQIREKIEETLDDVILAWYPFLGDVLLGTLSCRYLLR